MLGFSKEDRKIRKAIDSIKAYLLGQLKGKGLIALYLSGTIVFL
jgi:hypothetical protein